MTKAQEMRKMAQWLQRQPLGEVDNEWVLEVLRKHPKWLEKSANMDHIEVNMSIWNNKMIVLVAKDGSETPISYRSCFTKGKEYENEAFRNAISDQIQSFKKTIKKPVCTYCGLETKKYHVDHVHPFHRLVKQFGKKSDVEWRSQGKSVMVDEDVRNEWEEYHKANAKLCIACVSCNLKKGGDEIIGTNEACTQPVDLT
jgi:5-methylcytosine-specific restriction endonuclease McrA